MKKAAIVAALLYLLGQVWYWGFTEGWRQAVAALASTAQKEPAVGLAPLPAWRTPDNHSARL